MSYTPSYTGVKQLKRKPATGTAIAAKPGVRPNMSWEMGMSNPYGSRVSVGNAVTQAGALRPATSVAAPQAAVSQATPQMGMPVSGTASYESSATATNYGNARSLLRKQLNSYLASRYGMTS